MTAPRILVEMNPTRAEGSGAMMSQLRSKGAPCDYAGLFLALSWLGRPRQHALRKWVDQARHGAADAAHRMACA